jgi:tetratricopeptide (TPR) repeat protein
LADCLREQDDLAGATDHFQKALALHEKLSPKLPARRDIVMQNIRWSTAIAELYEKRGEFANAVTYHKKALKIHDSNLTSTAENLGDLVKVALGFDERRNQLVQALNNSKAKLNESENRVTDGSR